MTDIIELTINGKSEQLPAGRSIADLLRDLELDPLQVAVEVNRVLVPRDAHPDHLLSSGDEVEVVTLVGGG